MRIHFPLIFLTLNGVYSCTRIKEFDEAILDITYATRIEDAGNMEYKAFIDFSFNINASTLYDGMLYRFVTDSSERRRKKRYFPGAPTLIAPDDACKDVHDNFWTVTDNGTSVLCQVPCEDFLEKNLCPGGGVCRDLSQGYQSLKKDTNKLSRPIKFGRIYRLHIHLYRGWRVGGDMTWRSEKSVIFCRHELLTNFDVSYDKVEEFCKRHQHIDWRTFISGPITNFSIRKKWTNLETNKGEAIIFWQDPYDIYPNVTITKYEIRLPNGDLLSVPRKNTTTHQAHLKDLNLGESNQMTISAAVAGADLRECSGCAYDGFKYEFSLPFADIDACAVGNETTPYCMPVAECKDLPSSEPRAALCTCPDGYQGNGVNPSYNQGTGCEKDIRCENEAVVKSICDENSICLDNPTLPGLNCSCPDGFDGDGYINGTGCEPNTFQRDAMIVGICIGVFMIVIVAIFIGAYYYKKQKDSRLKLLAQYQVSSIFSLKFSNGRSENLDPEKGLFGKKWELERSKIELKGIIGRGNFGVVQRAILNQEEGKQLVAVKMTNEGTPQDQKTTFIHEISILSVMEPHPNLLGLIGCCSSGDLPVYMVTQYLKYGDLLGFLWKAREERFRQEDSIYNINELSVYHITSQVACGMQQLKKMKIIHGDLAARNILVGEGLQCKISDFGLANDVYVEGMIRDMTERTLPIRWVSPERMMGGKVPICWRSDVWSFGVLLYETVSLGSTPYYGIDTSELFAKLQTGYRMEKPDYCTQTLYDIMMNCWRWNPSKRPDFKSLEDTLKQTNSSQNEEYVDLHSVVPSLYDDSDVTKIMPSSQGLSYGFRPSISSQSEKLV